MTKAALFTLGLAALLVFPAAVPAQDNSTALAVNEAVLRQAKTIDLRQKLSDARATAQRGETAVAAKLYQEACTLVTQIGSGIDVETAQAVAGLTATRMALARDAQSRGDLREADTQVLQVIKTEKELKVAPDLNQVIAFKSQNDQMLAAMKGRMPSEAVTQLVPHAMEQQVEVGTLVQDGKLFYEMGKLPEAEGKLYEALKIDPDNTGAYYYLNLIQQAKISRSYAQHTVDTQTRMEKVEKQWVLPTAHPILPIPNPYATNTLVYTGPGRQAIVAKLDHVRLDNFSTGEGMPLSEVLRNLAEQARLRDPERRGINFLINPNADKSGQAIAAPANTGFGGGFGGGLAGGGFGAGGAVPGGAPGAGAAVDPATGLPVAPAPAANGGSGGGEAADVGAYMIKIPSLMDVRLSEVLDAICLVSDHPLKYSIQDFAIVFQAKGEEQVVLSMRTFKVDPNTFYSGLESVSSASFGGVNNNGSSGGNGGSSGGGGGGQNQNSGAAVGVVNAFSGQGGLRNYGSQGGGGGGQGGGQQGGTVNPLSNNGGQQGGGGGGNIGGQGGLNYITQVTLAATPSEAARAFFTALGVNLQSPAGKSVFFNDKSGILFVTATERDLDTIERAIQTLNQIAQEVHIKARFIEVQQKDDKAVGFDWYLGQFNMGNNVSGTGGTSPSLNVPASAANPLGAFPGNTAATIIPGAATDQQLFGSGSSAPTVATMTGILTDPNFRVAMHMLQTRTGFENLAEPEATTISGRQTQMRATEMINVVTGFSFNNGSSAGANNNTVNGGTGGSVVNQAGVASVEPNTQPMETGPVLDVVPYILSDGYTINMALIPSYTEFNGYDTITAGQIPGYVPGSTTGNLNSQTLPVALPRFTVRQVVTTVNVWDNQTVVLGGLISSTVQNTKSQLPVIGDIPLLGRLFQNQAKTATKQNLMIFVTATIVDPAGNRVHSDDDLPFAQTGVPPQPPGAGQMTETVQKVRLPGQNP